MGLKIFAYTISQSLKKCKAHHYAKQSLKRRNFSGQLKKI